MSRRITSLAVLLVGLGSMGITSAQTATRFYWTEWYSYNPDLSRIARANVDGTDVETLLDGFNDGTGVKDLVVDGDAGKLYFANRTVGLIERTNLDGTGRETVLTDAHPSGLALDVDGGKIYWADYTYSDPRIRRADLDGTNVETLVSASDGCQLEGIVLDLAAGHIYWAERMTQHIKRANLDGSGVTLILACWEGIGHPWGLALAGGRIYWASDESIFSANLAGEDVQTLVSDLPDSPRSLEMDAAAGQLYWVTGGMYGGLVQRINLDGTGLETLMEGLYYGYGLALEFGGAVAAPDVRPPVVRLDNHPNPFNPRTELVYNLPTTTHVRLTVFDPRGRRVRTLVDGVQAAGTQAVVWDGRDERGRDQASGVYFTRLQVGELTTSHKMLLAQ